MNAYKVMRTIIFAVSIITILKAVLMIGWPNWARHVAKWWVGLPVRLLRVIGTLIFLLGLLCIVTATMAVGDRVSNRIIITTLVMGTLGIVGGLAYHVPDVLRAVARPWTGGNDLWLRICGVAALVVSLVLLWVVFL